MDHTPAGALRSPRGLSLALALVTSATMLLEVALTRIFSVTMWYHYAFMAISVALFGMAFGAVVVYLRPAWFPQARLHGRLAGLSLLFALTTVATFWMHLQIPFAPELSVRGVASVLVTFVVISIPFIASGLVVSLLLTRFPEVVGRLYGYDLAGAAVGCLLFSALIGPLSGPGVVLAAATLASLAAVVFALADPLRGRRVLAGVTFLALLAMTIFQPNLRLLHVGWNKDGAGQPAGELPELPLYERWNTHSVLTVYETVQTPFGWGMSRAFVPDHVPPQLLLRIDAAAGTVITRYGGDPGELGHLGFDITALAHHVRPGARTLVIGAGGGRDVLTALAAGTTGVTGVEINGDILDLVNGTLGNFTGHLDRLPNVRFVHDEARSWIERTDLRFDIVQASLIDSWAATAAGAFVLTENGLYTVEAWTEFLNHLTDRGLLTFSRWWVKDRPGEMLRCAALAHDALRRLGVAAPRRHVMIAVNDAPGDDAGLGVGTILVSRQPFSDADVQAFRRTCDRLQFQVLVDPDQAAHDDFARVLDPATHDRAIADYPILIAAPTDDSPFFFNMLRFGSLFSAGEHDQRTTQFNMKAIVLLAGLFALVLVLSLVGLVLPFWLHERRATARGEASLPRGPLTRHSLYFAAIGLGFILVEMSQIQRLTLFLGHPVYSLTVVLFTLLLATGLGSVLVGRFVLQREPLVRAQRARLALGLALGVTTLAALGLPPLLQALHGSTMGPRIALAAAALFALGLPMGTAFPIGLAAASRDVQRATPLLWAVNGALSVVGSVLAVILSIRFGITLTALVGAACYLVALVVLLVPAAGPAGSDNLDDE